MGIAYIDVSTKMLEDALEFPPGIYIVGHENGAVRLTIEGGELPDPREDGSLQKVTAVITQAYKSWEFEPEDG